MIKRYEALKLTQYDVGGQKLIGYGHAMAAGEPVSITKAQADALFASDAKTVADLVSRTITRPLSQNQFDALVSLVEHVIENAAFR